MEGTAPYYAGCTPTVHYSLDASATKGRASQGPSLGTCNFLRQSGETYINWDQATRKCAVSWTHVTFYTSDVYISFPNVNGEARHSQVSCNEQAPVTG